MIRMIQRRLIIPRGDTGSFSIPYLKTISPGDVAVFTIFDIRTKTKMYQKLIAAEGDILNIAFTHGDTVNLKPGKYLWDIKIYTNPQIIDDELVNGDEVDSYYAGFSLPECEIRETGDTLLTSDDAPTSTISPESLNIINAAINEVLNTKRAAVEAAETASSKADAAAESAEDASDSAAAASQSAATAEARVNEIESLSVEVNTGLEGTDANVTYTPSTGVLSFIIPRGNTGNGIESCVLNDDFTLTINYTNGDSTTTIPIRGDTPHLTIGEVTEGPNAIATITGTDANPILNLTLPNANVPTRVSQLENDSGYLTEHQDLSDYVQKTDYATKSTAGIVKVAGLGVKMDNDELTLAPASPRQIKQGTGDTAPIVAAKEHESTFYGLAKAAGDTTQGQSSNAVGTYTDEAKAAIQQMLDVPANADIPTQVSQLTNDAGYLTSFTETDPTVPAWAKAAQKPSYTAAEVGAPTVSEMNSAISEAIGQVNSFDMTVVQELPTTDISTHTIYLVPKTGETNDVYDEYIYINNAWEMVGNTQIDLSNYVQKTDYATSSTAGIVRVRQTYGLTMDNDTIKVFAAPSSHIKAGAASYTSIVPYYQHESTFYGLAKAAGDTTQSQSDNAVGTYTDEAKAAIRNMIGAPALEDIPEAPVQDVQVNGQSVVNEGVANVDAVIIPGTGIGSAKTRDFEEDGHTYVNDGSGMGSFAEGLNTHANGLASHSENQQTYANGDNSHAEGLLTFANGLASHAEGRNMYAFGDCSHVEGGGSAKVVKFTGDANTVKYVVSVFIPIGTIVKRGELGDAIVTQIEDIDGVFFATLDKTLSESNALENQRMQTFIGGALESHSHVEGSNSIALSVGQHVEGKNNATSPDFAHIVGNGSSSTVRSNAYALTWTGDGHYAGDVYVHANADSTGGTKLATIEDIPDAPVQDVQVNGTSVVSNGVANIPVASNNTSGVVMTNNNAGTQIINGYLATVTASSAQVKAGASGYQVLQPGRQHESTFYGLAKAAGADMATIANTTVGTYPDAQKEAIQSMLGITQMLAPTNPNLVASQPYSIGEVFAANGHLYKATAAIAQDAAIIPDTNCVETTMAEAGGKIKDVQVAGSSVVGSDGVADIPIATGSTLGVMKVDASNGVAVLANPSLSTYGALVISPASIAQIKTGTNGVKPIVPNNQHSAIFYGLSKAAGVDLANETVTLGTYPEASKTAIKAMLGVQDGLKVVRLI